MPRAWTESLSRLVSLWDGTRRHLAAIGRPLPLLAAGVFMAGCAASVLFLFSTLEPDELRQEKEYRNRVLAFERANHRLMMTVVGQSAGHPLPAGLGTASEAWRKFDAVLDLMCQDLPSPQPELPRLAALCRADGTERSMLSSALSSFSLPQRPLDPALLRTLMAQRDEVLSLREWVLARSFALEARMDEDYEWAISAIEASAAGLAASAFMLLFLTGRASLRHLNAAQEAADAANEAQRADRLLRETIEAVPAAIAVYDRNERLMMFNARARELTPILALPGCLGKTYEQLLRDMLRLDTLRSGLTDETIARRIEQFRKQETTIYRSSDGRWFELRTVGMPSGNFARVRLDVSTAVEYQNQLQRERERYQTLVESLTDTVFALDRNGAYVFASATVLTLLGVPADQIIGRNHYDFIHPDDLEQARADAVALFRAKSREMHQRLLRMRTVDGEVRYVEVRYRRPPRTDVDAGAVVGLMRDVTTTVRMTRRLDEERTRLRSVIESSGATFLLTDRDLNIQLANREFWRLLGMVPDSGVGEPMTKFMATRLDPGQYRRWLSSPLSPEDLKPARYTSRQPDAEGNQRVFLVTVTPVIDDDRRLHQIVFVAVDDTDRHAAEQALYAADRMATLGEMAATVVHDLRQPLQVMAIACASAVEEIDDRAFVLQKLKRIEKQIERANVIVEDLRLYARGDAAAAAVPFNVEDAIRSAVDLVKSAHPRSGVKLTPMVQDGIPELTGQRARLEQVLVNLLSNAIEAGALAVEIGAQLHRSSEKDFVRLRVADDGPGIPAELLPKLFESFVTTKPGNLGTGLGLRICRRLIEEMGGSVSAGNRADGGAEFTILLPVQNLPVPARTP